MREDWVDIELATVCEKVEKVKRKEMPLSGKLKYLDIGGIDNTTNRIVSHKDFTWQDAPSRAQQIVKKGDVLFSTVRTYLKNIALVRKDEYNDEICSSGFTVLRGKTNVLDSNYLFYLSLSVGFLNPLNKLQTGTSYPAVRDKDVFAKIIPLAPFLEQRAIVAKIEELFSDLDKGIADLKKAQAQLVVYRQAVLKKAFEGELTKKWREKQTNLPSAEELLEQIKEERQKHYSQQLEDWKKAVKDWEENGKKGKKPGKPKKLNDYKNVDSPIQTNPKKWITSNLEQIGFWTGGGTPSKSNMSFWTNGTVLWVTSKDMKSKDIFDSQNKITPESIDQSSAKLINENSVLVVLRSGILRRILPVAINRTICTVNQDLQAITPYSVKTEFIYWFLVANEFDIRHKCAKDGTTVESIEANALKSYAFPYCSKAEQHQIVQEIESRLSVYGQVEQSITESLEKAKAIRQSILKKAFEGALLSEAEIAECKKEKDYEPASVLLERIRSEQDFKN